MSSFQLYDSATGDSSHGFIWPLEDAAAGGVPSVSSWRQWGHSWAAGGYDDFNGERNRSRFSERIAGMMHLAPHAVANEAIAGAAVMDALGSGAIGFGKVLQKCVPHALSQSWPWEPNRFGVEACLWGVNDLGTGGLQNSGSYWAGQGAMWDLVWANTMRSVIQRFIAGAIYLPDGTGLYPALWGNVNSPPNNLGVPAPNMQASFACLPKGPGGVGIGSWVFKVDNRANSGPGYWYTTANGDQMVITVPQDYDTGTVAIRHLCPGSYFDGPVENRNPLGVTPAGSTNTPANNIHVGAEHQRSPSAVTVVGGNINATVNCQGLANRMNSTSVNPAAGGIGAPGAMSHVSRHALTPTPGTKQTLTLTVGGLPAGGWYGFDSFEIQAKQQVRPIVLMANVANPANWAAIYGFNPATVHALVTARAVSFSSILASVCAEFADPGIMVADIRSKIAQHPVEYAQLIDTNIMPPNVLGATVEISSSSTYAPSGDGTHPHAMGGRDISEAYLDALAEADLPRGRGAIPFAPGRSLAYTRTSGN